MTNPDNPLYAVKRWEQNAQISLANPPENQAESKLQIARDRLNTLSNLTGAVHAQAYREALVNLDQQIRAATIVINALAAGAERVHMASELAILEADVRHTLRRLLSELALSGRLLTTEELGRLGDTVPHLMYVVSVLSAHPNGQAIISISGDDIQPGAQLLMDNRLVKARGSLQKGLFVFVATWIGNQYPQSRGIVNPDDTADETTTITLNGSDDHGNSNNNSNHGGNGNGNSRGKP